MIIINHIDYHEVTDCGFGTKNGLRPPSSEPAKSLDPFFTVGDIVASLLVFLRTHHCFWFCSDNFVRAAMAGLSVRNCVGAALAGLAESERTSFSKKIHF